MPRPNQVLAAWIALYLAATAYGADALKIAPAPRDSGRGLLFHCSFDTDRRAEVANGLDLPAMARYARQNRTAQGGTHVKGVFGRALTGRCGRGGAGHYDALGNIMAECGTVAFHIRQEGMHYGFETLVMQTVDPYYWRMYLRMSNKSRSLSAWFPNEVYKPVVVSAGRTAKLTEHGWHHIAVAWDQAYGARYYFDGKQVGSNWGRAAWTSRGVDPDKLVLKYDRAVAYDELYIFDRALTARQILALAKRNQPPKAREISVPAFTAKHRRNRLRERSWSRLDPAMMTVALGKSGLGANAVRQVLPVKARAVKKECNAVFDGKLGNGWPPLYNYHYAGGNGLHVEVGGAYDYVLVEGYFNGLVYGQRQLLPGGKPLAEMRSPMFMNRWALDAPRAKGWLSYFKQAMEEKGKLPDKELVTTSRICEMGFFRRNTRSLGTVQARRYYLGGASVPKALPELTGRYGPGDRATLRAVARWGTRPTQGQALPGLRYHHVLIASPTATPLKGLRLMWWLRGRLNGNALWVEMHDPALPGRRLFGCDFALSGAKGDGPQLLDLTLDVADRMLPANRPLWLTFCFKQDVELLWPDPERRSCIELLTGTREEVLPDYLDAELAFAVHRFRELSEPRPWGVHKQPTKEMPPFNRLTRELFYPLVELRKYRPDDAKLTALWVWIHKHYTDTSPVEAKPVPGCEGAPRWALLHRELLRGCGGVLSWWIQNRQTPNGEFGDAWGDDTDLTQNFAKMCLLGDPNAELRNAAARVADGVYREKLVERGINRRVMDTLHAYEEGVNVQPVMALIDYGSPKYLERMMESTRTTEEYLTKKDAKGRRRFRSGYFGAEGVRDKGRYGFDHPGNALFCHAALSLAYYSRNPRAVRLLREWIDGWLDYYQTAKPPDKRRPFPKSTLMDGTVQSWDTKVRGYGFVDVWVALFQITGDRKYASVAQYFTGAKGPGGGFFRGSGGYLPGLELIDHTKWRKQLIKWADEADLSKPGSDGMGRAARERYMRYEVTGDEKAAYQALEACVRKLRLTYHAYTWGEPINDRIWPPDNPAIMMAQGEMSHVRNQLWPRHYVSYMGLSDFGAWVRQKSDTQVRLWIYSFAESEEQGLMRVWRTPLGEYEVAFGADRNSDGRPDTPRTRRLTLHRSAGIPVTLPPRTLCAMQVRLVKRSAEDYWLRPDLGISPDDVLCPAENRCSVTVHNLGNSPVANVVVRLTDAAGGGLAEQRIGRLDAPVDLMPRTARVTFSGPGVARAAAVVLDPGNAIAELNEMNNTVHLRQRKP